MAIPHFQTMRARAVVTAATIRGTLLMALLFLAAFNKKHNLEHAGEFIARDSILVFDTASGLVHPLLSEAYFLKKVTGRSAAQISNWREYYSLTLNDAKRKALKARANVLEVTYYHNFRFFPFGARLRACLYRADSQSLRLIELRISRTAHRREQYIGTSCILHVKSYVWNPIDLYLDDSLIVAGYPGTHHSINSTVEHNPERVFRLGHGGGLYESADSAGHKNREVVLATGHEHFVIILYEPHNHKLRERMYPHLREVSRSVFERDY